MQNTSGNSASQTGIKFILVFVVIVGRWTESMQMYHTVLCCLYSMIWRSCEILLVWETIQVNANRTKVSIDEIFAIFQY